MGLVARPQNRTERVRSTTRLCPNLLLLRQAADQYVVSCACFFSRVFLTQSAFVFEHAGKTRDAWRLILTPSKGLRTSGFVPQRGERDIPVSWFSSAANSSRVMHRLDLFDTRQNSKKNHEASSGDCQLRRQVGEPLGMEPPAG